MSDNVPEASTPDAAPQDQPVTGQTASPTSDQTTTEDVVEEGDAQAERIRALESLVSERTADLQRLQAEYVNYKKRVDRDRNQSRASGVEAIMVELLPVLDSLALAEEHGELTGGFKLVADEIGKITARHGLTSFGEKGDEFDPHRHEALMNLPMPGVTVTTCSQVMQKGYLLNDRVLRPARVAVSDPDPDAVSAVEAAEAALKGSGDAPENPDSGEQNN